jgi:hypothetical protein
LKQSKEAANQPIVDDGKKLDLKFKEGQTITINIGVCLFSEFILVCFYCDEFEK